MLNVNDPLTAIIKVAFIYRQQIGCERTIDISTSDCGKSSGLNCLASNFQIRC